MLIEGHYTKGLVCTLQKYQDGGRHRKSEECSRLRVQRGRAAKCNAWFWIKFWTKKYIFLKTNILLYIYLLYIRVLLWKTLSIKWGNVNKVCRLGNRIVSMLISSIHCFNHCSVVKLEDILSLGEYVLKSLKVKGHRICDLISTGSGKNNVRIFLN